MGLVSRYSHDWHYYAHKIEKTFITFSSFHLAPVMCLTVIVMYSSMKKSPLFICNSTGVRICNHTNFILIKGTRTFSINCNAQHSYLMSLLNDDFGISFPIRIAAFTTKKGDYFRRWWSDWKNTFPKDSRYF